MGQFGVQAPGSKSSPGNAPSDGWIVSQERPSQPFRYSPRVTYRASDAHRSSSYSYISRGLWAPTCELPRAAEKSSR